MKFICSALPRRRDFFTSASKTSLPRQPIIDMHIHAHTADKFGRVGLPNPATGKPSMAMTDEGVFKMTIDQMRRYNIVKAAAGSFMESAERWRAAAPDLSREASFACTLQRYARPR